VKGSGTGAGACGYTASGFLEKGLNLSMKLFLAIGPTGPLTGLSGDIGGVGDGVG
jgi:hypothetical protein